MTEHFELFAFGIGTFYFSEQKEVHINVSGGWSVSNCLRKQRVGGQQIVYVCLLGVGGWSKIGKNLFT